MIKETDGCKNNPEKLSTAKISQHIPLDFLMCKIFLFKSKENKHEVNHEQVLWSLRKHTRKIISFENNEFHYTGEYKNCCT